MSSGPLIMFPLLVISLLFSFNLPQSEASVGICYKTPEKNQPSPAEVVAQWEQLNITRVRLYEPNHEVLTALKGKNIEVLLGVPNSVIIPFATNPNMVEAWVRANITAYYPDVKIKYLVVGNEISPTNNFNGQSFFLGDTLSNFKKALSKEDRLKNLKMTTSFDTSVLIDPYSFNPSAGMFAPPVFPFIDPVLKLISNNSAPVLVNLHPYYAHILRPNDCPLDRALFKGSNGSLFEAMLETMYSALGMMGYGSMDVIVAETGWPSAGGVEANVENQKTYITKLLEQVKKGTSSKPNKPIETYLYSMFDEDVKGVPEVERHWGLFTPNKQFKFGASSNLCFS